MSITNLSPEEVEEIIQLVLLRLKNPDAAAKPAPPPPEEEDEEPAKHKLFSSKHRK